MAIRRKPIDTLKQQKNSFVNYIKNKEKYSEIIADLFYDEEIGKFDNVEDVRRHLEQKGISKELIDSLESDYVGYLKSHSYYGFVDDLSDDMAESIKENDKVLGEIKKSIVKKYKDNEEFLSLDVNKFIGDEFGGKFRDLGEEIISLEKGNKDLKKEKFKIENFILELEAEYEGLSIFQLGRKKKIKSDIEENQIKEQEIQEEIDKKVKEYGKKSERNRRISELSSMDGIKKFLWGRNRDDMKSCKQSIEEIKLEMYEYMDYIPQESFDAIKTYIVGLILEKLTNKKNSLVEMINKYLNYFYFGEDKGYEFMKYYKCNDSSHGNSKILEGPNVVSTEMVVPTLYSKSKVDVKIVDIINKLGCPFETGNENVVDPDFINDVFVHTTGFSVLDEILEEGGLISTNEARERSRNNKDIYDSITQHFKRHKDVYFSRGFRKNGNGHHESGNDDFVFLVNTMSNFASKGYGVPLNQGMQPHCGCGLNEIEADGDTDGYSIISKSSLEEKGWGNSSYSRIDVKDLYIFVSETKRKEIESNPKYRTSNANIIYIPEKYKGGMSYGLYKFIKKEIALRSNGKVSLIPNKVVTDKDGIESIDSRYQWAFCDSEESSHETLFNPIKNGDYVTMINFLRTNQDAFRLNELNFKVDYQRLESFLKEQRHNIDNLELPFEYPKELLVLIIMCTKLGLGFHEQHDGRLRCLGYIKDKLREFGYDIKDLGILCKSVEGICFVMEYKDYGFIMEEGRRKDRCNNYIRKWCDTWEVDYDKMKEFLIKVSNITSSKYVANLLKDILKY